MSAELINREGIINKIKKGGKMGKDQFVIFILIGILLIVVALPTSKTSEKKAADSGVNSKTSDMVETETFPKEMITGGMEGNGEAENYESYLENKLEKAISVMEGAGRVKVVVTVNTSKERIVEKDNPTVRGSTIENDAEGGTRNINEMDAQETTVFVKENDGSTTPYVVKTLQPMIEGVLVIVQGGDIAQVKNNITESIVALFDIEPHKIKVVKMKSE